MQISNKDISWQYFLKQILFEKSSDITAADIFRRIFLFLLIYKIFRSCNIWWVKCSLLFNKLIKIRKGKKKMNKKSKKVMKNLNPWQKNTFSGNVKKSRISPKTEEKNHFTHLPLYISLNIFGNIILVSINQSILMTLTLKLCLLAYMISFYFRIYR